jgi:hypothetical protein
MCFKMCAKLKTRRGRTATKLTDCLRLVKSSCAVRLSGPPHFSKFVSVGRFGSLAAPGIPPGIVKGGDSLDLVKSRLYKTMDHHIFTEAYRLCIGKKRA